MMVLHVPEMGFVTDPDADGFEYGTLRNAHVFTSSRDALHAVTARAANFGRFDGLELVRIRNVPTPMGAIARVIVEEL